MIYIPLLCGCLVTNDVTAQHDVDCVQQVRTNGGNVNLSSSFLAPKLFPRSTFVYRWSRLKEESPGILFDGKVE